MLALKAINGGKEGHFDTFVAGLVGGYTVFGRDIQNPVSQQIVIYVFARVALAVAKLAVQPRGEGKVAGSGGGLGLVGNEEMRAAVLKNAWPVFASLSWACVMYMFRWHPETVQPSLRSSMNYMYVDLGDDFGPYRLTQGLNICANTNKGADMSNRIPGTLSATSFGTMNRSDIELGRLLSYDIMSDERSMRRNYLRRRQITHRPQLGKVVILRAIAARYRCVILLRRAKESQTMKARMTYTSIHILDQCTTFARRHSNFNPQQWTETTWLHLQRTRMR